MHVTVVYIHVKPEHVADFIEAVGANHAASVQEPGNLRFDILRSVEDPTRFITYMAYRDEASARAHRETPHYFAFRDTVADWMVEPRRNVEYVGLWPTFEGRGPSA
ncbi:MAG TPA: antibiotic biosynthesis monooxygenase [Candidatus Sulfotelmatobacter sp.]|jgi:autoinducer 2-degrading protein|nr:antibiotic biosynthesis monooxygenase [Candidatus Sulfotelmatobacter sp.]